MPSPTQCSLSSAQMVTNPFQSLPKTYWVNSTPTPPPGRSYPQLKLLCKSLLPKEREDAAPDPARYPYHPSLAPHPFMGLDKFTRGRLHQMRSGRSYLCARPTWDSDVPTTCPSCDEALETFEHAILRCQGKEPETSRHLHGPSDIGPDTPSWSSVLGGSFGVRYSDS